MASRVIYGLASQGLLPSKLAYINPITRTPLVATGIILLLVVLLALFFPMEQLAKMTSGVVLSVFMLVNLALIRIKSINKIRIEIFQVPFWVPVLGFISSLLLIISGFI